MSKSNTALDRKMVKKHHKLTFGYLIFYSAILSLASLGLSFLLGSVAGTIQYNIPAFIYESTLGMLYIYNAVAIVLQWLVAFLFPGIYHFKGLSDNSWNMLYKMDVKPGGLAMNKIRICIFSNLGIYLMGFVLSAGIGFLKSSMLIPESGELLTIILLAVCGIMALLTFVTPALAIGAASKGKLLIRLTILIAGGLIGFFIYFCGYFNCTQASDIAASTSTLISLNPFGLLLIPALFAIVFPIITLSTASTRARNYNVEELDNELLVSLGVDENMLILEEGRNRYNVAISGPDVNDADFDIEVPEMVSRPQARPPLRETDMPPREHVPPVMRPQQQYDEHYNAPPMQQHGQNGPGTMPPQNPGPRRDNMPAQQNMGGGKNNKRDKKRRKDDYDEYEDY